MPDRFELSSFFTHLFNKSRQAAAYNGVEHTLKNAHRAPLIPNGLSKLQDDCVASENPPLLFRDLAGISSCLHDCRIMC